MLLLATLFISLTVSFGCAAARPSPRPRYVVDVRRPRGLAPRQNVAGVVLDSPNDVPGTGITRLVFASDHRYPPTHPILAQAPGPHLLTRSQFILCHHCCREHQFQAGGRHGIFGYFHHLDGLCVACLPFDPEVPSEISESHIRPSQRKLHGVQCELCGRNLCVLFDRVLDPRSFPNLATRPFYVTFQPTFHTTDSSGYVARESVRVANLTVPDQAFGVQHDSSTTFQPISLPGPLFLLGVVNQTTVAFTDQISGVLGFGFPRLSRIYGTAAHGNRLSSARVLPNPYLKRSAIGTPFFSTLAQRGIVDYPIFGIYLTRNSTGTLSLGQSP